MTIDNTLERLMEETDPKLQAKEKININDMVKRYSEDRIEKKVYSDFLDKYAHLKKDYFKEKNYLTSTKEPELNYGEIGWNTFWGAIIGFNTVRSVTTATIGAAIGGGMTYYKQKKDANMDLSNLFWWTLIGGWAGKGFAAYFDPGHSEYYAILGQGTGCGLAMLKELKKVRPELTPEERAMKLQALEAKHPQDVQQLVQTTKIEYMNKVNQSKN